MTDSNTPVTLLPDGNVCTPKGFRVSGIHCGLRRNKTKKDLALIVSDVPAAAAAVYTGRALDFSEEVAKTVLLEQEVSIIVTLHDGDADATAWGCDLSYEYVRINGDYRS